MFIKFGGLMKAYLKLNEIFSRGYLPRRGREEYKLVKGIDTAEITNCFEHACFNLTNRQLTNFNSFDLDNFFSLPALADADMTKEEMFDGVVNAIERTGLKVKPMKDNLAKNEWNVAMYVSQYNIDVHFLLQEKDGSWSGKFGQSKKVDRYSFLPLKIEGAFEAYNLYKILTLENPYYIEKEDKKSGVRMKKKGTVKIETKEK